MIYKLVEKIIIKESDLMDVDNILTTINNNYDDKNNSKLYNDRIKINCINWLNNNSKL